MRHKRLVQIFLLVLLILCSIFFYTLNLKQYLSFEVLKQNRHMLLAFVEMHQGAAIALYILVYIIIVVLSFPGAAFMTITGGFLFGLLHGTVYVVCAATIGATLLFLLARFIIADIARKRATPWLLKLQKGFQEDGLNYLLFLRLIPVFPFFVVNLAAAILGVPLRTFVLATFFGIIPGTFVYVSIGTGLGSIFDRGDTFTLEGILTPEILLALGGLAFLALLPVIYRKIAKRKTDHD